MRQLLIILTLALLPHGAAARCEGVGYLDSLPADDRAHLDAQIARTPYARGLFWQARRGDDRLLLIGTMHVYDPRLTGLRERASRHLADATLLMVEAGPAEEAALQNAIATDPALMFISEGPTLPEQLAPDIWESLVGAARARQIPAFLAAKMQPWYLAMTLAIPPCAMPELAAGQRGLDHMLISDALAEGVTVQALEPWDTLFTILGDGSPQEQIDMLRMSLIDPALQSEIFISMLDSYFAGDVATIWEASRLATRKATGLSADAAEALFAKTEQQLLTDRNRAWLSAIETATAAHDRMVIAVGAAHLPGTSGLLNLLAADGWTLAPVE